MSPIEPFGWNDDAAPALDATNLELMLQDAGAYTDAETARAEGAESALSSRITTVSGVLTTISGAVVINTNAITAEIGRAEAAEGVLTNTLITISGGVVANTNAIVAETNRAEAAETTISGSIHTVSGASLQKINNLSDVQEAGASRQNLHIPVLSAVACVASGNVSSLNGLPTFDGYTLTNSGIALLTGQSTASQNGPWIVYSGQNWTRPTDFATGNNVKARSVDVIQGTQYSGSRWLLQTNTSVTVDTSPQTWTLQLPPSVVSSSYALDACRGYGCVPATQLTVTLNSTTTATVTAGTAPASGAIIGPGIPAGTTFTASGATLTLSNAATLSSSQILYAGMDCTTAIQNAVNAAAAFTNGGEVYFSIPGVYLVNGALQTGTVASATYTTTTSGTQTFPEATVTVASTSGFPSSGALQIAGVTGVVTYAGISGNTFTGCSGGTGTNIAGAAVALAYSYSGQILYPAAAFVSTNSIPVKIRGLTPASTGDITTGQANGVILYSSANTAGGYIFAAVPYSSQWNWQWTGVMPLFQDIVLESPNNPQGGFVDAESCLRASFERFVCLVQGTLTSALPTGTTEAIKLPHASNNGDVTLRNVQIRGVGAGVRLSEHAALDNVDISFSAVAFTCIAGGHANWFGYVDIEECGTIFQVGTSVYGTVLYVVGSIDMENVETSGVAPTSFAYLPNSTSGLVGNLDLFVEGGVGSLGIKQGAGAGGNVDMTINNVGYRGPFAHPVDTFARLGGVALPSGTAPGLSWPTLDAWRVLTGQWQISASSVLTNANAGGSSQAYVPVRDGLTGGKSRRIQYTITTGASYNCTLVAQHAYPSNGTAVWVQLASGNLNFGIGTTINGTPIQQISGITGSTTYTVAIEVYIAHGVTVAVAVYLNGVQKILYALTATQQAALAAGGSDPYLIDGIFNVDHVTSITAFQVSQMEPAPAAVASGTATLASGTVSVANVNITANSIIRLNRQVSGGTLGELSVALTAGTGFAINSSSGSETSTVFWEIVSL